MSYHTRTIAIMVKPEGDPTFSEMATTIQIEDEAGGEFVVVSQHGTPEMGQIAINPEEWPTLRDGIDRMIAECRTINALAQADAACGVSPGAMGSAALVEQGEKQ